jgi:hypothetical protein
MASRPLTPSFCASRTKDCSNLREDLLNGKKVMSLALVWSATTKAQIKRRVSASICAAGYSVDRLRSLVKDCPAEWPSRSATELQPKA